MKKTLIALALLTPFASASAVDRLSYNYAELGYSRFNGDVDSDGFTLNGSIDLGDRFNVFAGYTDFSVDNDFFDQFDQFNDDFAANDADAKLWQIGLGYHQPISNTMDLVARAAFQQVDYDYFDSDGGYAEVGVRSLFMPNFEGHAYAGYQDDETSSGDVFARIGGQWYFNDNWGLVADAKFIDGDQVYFIGPRWTFR